MKKSSHFRWLVVHLAVADALCVAVSSMHFLHLLYGNGKWNMSIVLCKFITFIGSLTVNVSAWILCLMGYERYRAICNPFSRRFSRKIIHIAVIVCWIICIGLNIDLIWHLEVIDNKCYPVFKTYAEYVIKVVVILLADSVIPFVLLSYYLLRVVVTFRKRAKYIDNTKCLKRLINIDPSAFQFFPKETIELKTVGFDSTNYSRRISRSINHLSVRKSFIPEHICESVSPAFNSSGTVLPLSESSIVEESITLESQVLNLTLLSTKGSPNTIIYSQERGERVCPSNHSCIPSESLTSPKKLSLRKTLSDSFQNTSSVSNATSFNRSSVGSFSKDMSGRRSRRFSSMLLSRRPQSIQNLITVISQKKSSLTELANIRIKDLRDRATVNTLLFTIIFFFISTFPFSTFDFAVSLLYSNHLASVNASKNNSTLIYIKEWLGILLLSRSVMNIFIYCGKFPDFRQHVNAWLRFTCTRKLCVTK